MKIIAINGSYRKNGNTARMIDSVVTAMRDITAFEQQNLDFKQIHLGHQDIKFCRGCRVCFDTGEHRCPLKDDLLPIHETIQSANGLILASPVYVNDVSGIMKNWIDRMAFLCHRPSYAGKMALILTTVGLGPTKHAERTLSDALTTWGCSIVAKEGFKMGARMPGAQIEDQFHNRIKKIAGKFHRKLCQPPDPSFLSLMTFRIQQGYWWREPANNTLDSCFWQTQGWTNPERDYYIRHQARKTKVAMARLVGAILAPFVT